MSHFSKKKSDLKKLIKSKSRGKKTNYNRPKTYSGIYKLRINQTFEIEALRYLFHAFICIHNRND